MNNLKVLSHVPHISMNWEEPQTPSLKCFRGLSLQQLNKCEGPIMIISVTEVCVTLNGACAWKYQNNVMCNCFHFLFPPSWHLQYHLLAHSGKFTWFPSQILKTLKPPKWFPVNFSLQSSVSGVLCDLLSCTAGSQLAFRWWQHTSINLTNLVWHAVCNYFPLSSWYFSPAYFQFNLYVGKDSTFKKDR